MSRDILKDPPKHKTRFTLTARLYQPEEAVQQEVHASIDRLKTLLPGDIDPAEHPTLLYVAGNLAVLGVVNMNDDAVSLEDGLRTYRAFQWQQVNIEHNRGEIRGFIVRAGLSELGTDRVITEDEARAAGRPCNLSVIIALWKVADRDLVQYILKSAAPGSATKDDLSLSFEVGFDDYSIVVLPRGTSNLALAKRIVTSDDPAFGTWDKMLRVNKGSGNSRDGRVARVLAGEIIPLGAGIVTVPAAAVKGITPIVAAAGDADIQVIEDDNNDDDEDDTEAKVGVTYDYSSTQLTLTQAEAVPFLAFAANIPDEDLYTGEDGKTDSYGPKYGRENDAHCTALFGVTTQDPTVLAAALANFGPVKLTLGKVSAFENPEKPYDVLKVDVLGDDIHRLHAFIKTSVPHEETWPVFRPHLTLLYAKKGIVSRYIGDTRFEGQSLTFSSLTFTGTNGGRSELPLVPPQAPLLAAVEAPASAQDAAAQVYTSPEDPHDLMAAATTLSRHLHLSPGWETKLATLQAASGTPPTGGDPLQFGVTVTLSDGRVLKNLKIFDGKTLELDKETAFHGVIITDMTPGVPPQADNSPTIAPRLDDVYPNKRPEKVAEDEANLAKQRAAQNAPYTDAALKDAIASIQTTLALLISTLSSLPAQNVSVASVSTHTPMTLDDLKTLQASVQATDKVDDLKTAFANVALFAAEIAKASEAAAQARKDAETATATANTALTEVKAQLATLTTQYNEMVAAQQAAAAEQVYQERMTSLAEVFTFDDETRAEVVTEIKACADAAAFDKWMARAKKLYKGWLKSSQTAADFPPKKDDDKKDDKAKDDDCAKASKTALASAAAKVIDTPIHNMIDPTAIAAEAQTLKARYMAIASKNIRVGSKTVGELTAEADKVVRTTR